LPVLNASKLPWTPVSWLSDGEWGLALIWKIALGPIAALAVVISSAGYATAQEKSIVVASTSSTQASGLFDHVLPLFTMKTGIAVKVVAMGTGEALDIARRGAADVVFVHAKSAEQAFVAEGHGVKRYPVMYNDFVLIGPKSDPAGIKGMKDVAKALKAIKEKQATFISRGDNSGTHQFSGTRTLASTSRNRAGLGTNQLSGGWRAPSA
jgi:ABC-type tungstate transport system permease subunit